MIADGKGYLDAGAGLKDDKHTEAILEHFSDPELRETFYRFFGELEESYEILSPDAFLRSYIKDFSRLAELFRLLRSSFDLAEIDRSFARKTARLVQEHTRSGLIRPPDEVYELGEDALQKIADSDAPDVVKVFNLLKLIDRAIKKKGAGSAYLIPIGERAEAVIKAYQDRQISTQQALEQLSFDLEEVGRLERLQEERGLSAESMAGLLLLQQETEFTLLQEGGIDKTFEIAKEMTLAFEAFPHWRTSDEQERGLRATLYKSVMKMGLDQSETVDKLLGVLRRSGA